MGRVPPPFLSMDDRIQYLEDKNYFPCEIIFKDNMRNMLSKITSPRILRCI